ATISGLVTLAATATDNVGVVKVEFYSDGVLIGVDTSAPYAYKWNTRKVAMGTHSLQAKAYDAAGKVGVSVPVSVTVAR
ncbi:MAG TPA: Ig-like domain-containing protein, partial [Terriglobales bacterium]